jgi:hypothetical protein
MRKKWKDFLGAVSIVSIGFLAVLIIRPPKLDAIVKTNDPKLYVPLLCLAFVLFVLIAWRGLRNQ